MLNRLLKHVNLMEKGLDASWKRNQAIANNLANIDTPGYKRSDIDFKSEYNNQIKSNSKTSELSQKFKTEIVLSQKPKSKNNPTNQLPEKNLDSVSSFSAQKSTDSKSAIRMDGNNVDIDHEMTELAKNAILYDSLTFSISKEIGRIKYIIKEGR